MQRPAFEQLQHAVLAGTIKPIVVWKLNRLSRRLRDGVKFPVAWYERGVRVAVMMPQLDLHADVGRLVASVRFG